MLADFGGFDGPSGDPVVAVARVYLPPETVPAKVSVMIDVSYSVEISDGCAAGQLVVIANGIGAAAALQSPTRKILEAKNGSCVRAIPQPLFNSALMRVRLPTAECDLLATPVDLIILMTKTGNLEVGINSIEVGIPPPEPKASSQQDPTCDATPASAATQ